MWAKSCFLCKRTPPTLALPLSTLLWPTLLYLKPDTFICGPVFYHIMWIGTIRIVTTTWLCSHVYKYHMSNSSVRLNRQSHFLEHPASLEHCLIKSMWLRLLLIYAFYLCSDTSRLFSPVWCWMQFIMLNKCHCRSARISNRQTRRKLYQISFNKNVLRYTLNAFANKVRMWNSSRNISWA